MARIGNCTGGLKPYELMNQINGGGVNCVTVPVERVRAFLLDNKILPDPRVVSSYEALMPLGPSYPE